MLESAGTSVVFLGVFFFSSRRRHTRFDCDWSSDVCSSDLIGDRFLPDKAIDLVDEAASRLRIEIDSLPQEIDEVERKIVQYQIELAALAKEKDKTSKERRERVEQELKELRDRSNAMKAQWQAEKDAITKLQGKKAELEQLRTEADGATRRRDLQKAAEISYGRIPALEKDITALEKRLADIQKKIGRAHV